MAKAGYCNGAQNCQDRNGYYQFDGCEAMAKSPLGARRRHRQMHRIALAGAHVDSLSKNRPMLQGWLQGGEVSKRIQAHDALPESSLLMRPLLLTHIDVALALVALAPLGVNLNAKLAALPLERRPQRSS